MNTVTIQRTDQDLTEDEGSTRAHDAMVRLRPLLAAAASTDLHDHEAWTAILSVAHLVTADLRENGALPAHLTVAEDDVPVLAARTIAAAWKHATRTPMRDAAPTDHPR